MDIIYKCLECDHQEIVMESDYRKDGRRCRECGGYLVPFCHAGIDLAKGKDKTVLYTPPGQKNQKSAGHRKNG